MKSPAAPIRKSVRPDYLFCLEDRKQFRSLRRHPAGLGLTPAQHREKWRLPCDNSIDPPNYAAQRSAMAIQIGHGQLTRKAGFRKSSGRSKAAKTQSSLFTNARTHAVRT
jgi:predicted transcriptional regulator